jgi:hypothetical protein
VLLNTERNYSITSLGRKFIIKKARENGRTKIVENIQLSNTNTPLAAAGCTVNLHPISQKYAFRGSDPLYSAISH